MREKKWSKGPWGLAWNGYWNEWEVTAPDSEFHDEHRVLAQTWNDEEGEATARLIAAAPDLVEALEVLHSWIVDGGHLDEDKGAREVCAQAWAALAKAYGEGE